MDRSPRGRDPGEGPVHHARTGRWIRALDGKGRGVRIASVRPRGPAGRAGLEAGEEVFQVNGVEVADPVGYALALGKAKPGAPLELAIRRNYENAIKAAGGEVVFSEGSVSIMRATRNGAEVWAEIQTNRNGIYFLHVIERGAMQQVITADAMAAALDKDGFIALDIHFDTCKSDILPDSLPAVAQIVELLKKRPDLRVGIEGHTDNMGTPAGNKTLSEARAQSVTAAVQAGGITSARLSPSGFGQERPVADNRTEDGRAKNRRVEIVKK